MESYIRGRLRFNSLLAKGNCPICGGNAEDCECDVDDILQTEV